jgi:hypothetical protein
VEVGANGEVQKSWGPLPDNDPDVFWTRRYATALGPKDTVLYQEGTWPEIWLYQKGSHEHEVWPLHLPKHYREPPDKPYELRKLGFNRERMNQRRSSYTQVGEFFMLAQRYVAVLWAIHEPYESSLDIYDFNTRERVVADFQVPGTYIRAQADKLYLLEERDHEEEEAPLELVMHVYQLELD